MKRIFWILIAGIVLFLVIYGTVAEVKAAVDNFVLAVGGQTASTVGGWWAGVVADPTYQTYHVLIWLVGGIVLLFSLQRLYAKRPAWLLNKTTTMQTNYQNQPQAQAPVVIQQPQQSAAPVSPNPVVEEKPKEATA